MTAIPLKSRPYGGRTSPGRVLRRLGVDMSSPEKLAESLPFSLGDATCGCENELQAVVIGGREDVDLPVTIENSNYFRNIIKRQRRGEMPGSSLGGLEAWLDDNPGRVWENSWVRLPAARLSPLAQREFEQDLLADKGEPAMGQRSDAGTFKINCRGEEFFRLPASYLLKIALVDAMGSQNGLPSLLKNAGIKLAGHFLSDNTSPETYSFYISPCSGGGKLGRQAAVETAQRLLLTSLLATYAERCLGLLEHGQAIHVYFAPHPPLRQKRLSECITDAFYRELFMNPCLSGWDQGEKKHRYMHLCHQVLSRAQLNALGRLKEAGIITNNLVVLPNASNISLANNGTHVTLASRMLTQALERGQGGFTTAHEKYLADIVIKAVEHFLPLFVGTYSAAPYRLAFEDFHPELVLSFLPYELDYTHLRMIWRRWKKKADLKVRPLGMRLTPFGPTWLDRGLGRLLRLKGDFLPDYRLIDYMAAVMSTNQSPALDGSIGNQDRLKKDLAQMGVFDRAMPPYLFYRQREFQSLGFTGFEGRHYSLFQGLAGDLGGAVDMQRLITALAFALVAKGELDHGLIPDDPQIESERRQIVFGAAIGLPTFFVREDTKNAFLKELVGRTAGVRKSRRYPGCLRVRRHQYRRALWEYICEKGAGLIQCLDLGGEAEDLRRRLEEPEEHSALGRLTKGILNQLGAKTPLDAPADEFNLAAEEYYRGGLCRKLLAESLELTAESLESACREPAAAQPGVRAAMAFACGNAEPARFLRRCGRKAISGDPGPHEVVKLINLVVLTIHMNAARSHDAQRSQGPERSQNGVEQAPIHRTA